MSPRPKMLMQISRRIIPLCPIGACQITPTERSDAVYATVHSVPPGSAGEMTGRFPLHSWPQFETLLSVMVSFVTSGIIATTSTSLSMHIADQEPGALTLYDH